MEKQQSAVSNVRRFIQLILVVLAAGSIYPIIYLRTYFQASMLVAFHITLPQLNTIYSTLGIVFIIGYIPSGIIADKFSAKWLIAISLALTAVGGFWMTLIPTNYTSILIIYAIWGLASVFIFWSACLKMIKLLSGPGQEGRFFGILDGGRGLVEAIMASIAAVIFASAVGGASKPSTALTATAMSHVFWLYTLTLVIVCVLVAVFVTPDKKLLASGVIAINENDKFRFRDIGKVVQNPAVLLMGAIIFMGYAVTWTYYYYGGFLTGNIGISAATAATVMVVAAWMRPVGGIGGGVLADKFGKNATLIASLALSAIFLIALPLMPVHSGAMVFYIMVVLVSLFTWVVRGVYWSLLGDAKVAPSITGTAVGLVSFIGYWGDILVPILVTSLVAASPKGQAATWYVAPYFIISAVAGLIGILLILLFKRVTGKQESQATVETIKAEEAGAAPTES